jgi:methylglyoxal synthase
MKFALIAHDGKKADMVAFVMKRLDFFNRPDVDIVATGTTGKRILHAGVEKVQTVNSGPMGGDAEIGSMVAKGELEGVIFFRDPLDKHPHEPDVQMLLRLCDVHDVPLATNYKSASILVKHYSLE